MREFIYVALIYIAVASGVFKWNHPHLNGMQFWKHFDVAIKFEVVDGY